MSTALGTIRENIQAQGFCGLDDKTYAQINYPLRLSPAICMLWTAVGTALASPMILWALTPFAALGAILPGHPFDVLYNYGLRHLTGTPALPGYRARRRLASPPHDQIAPYPLDHHANRLAAGAVLTMRVVNCRQGAL